MKDVFLYLYYYLGRGVVAGLLGSLGLLGPVWLSIGLSNSWFLLLIAFFPLLYYCGQRIIGEM